jgi:hypothetical protein
MLEARPLDFGHWSAHKMEALTGYALRHGEAVALGVAIDTVYSSLALGFGARDVDRVLRCLGELGLPLGHPVLRDTDGLFAGLEEFRQHLGGRLTLTMLQGVGRPVEVHRVDDRLMRAAIARVAALGPTDQAWAPLRAEVDHVTFNHPVRMRGEEKRLLELSVAEAAPALVEAGLITADEQEHTFVEMQRLAADETVLAVMPRLAQVWARKPKAAPPLPVFGPEGRCGP